jgi:purine-nucleoside phosphorylase
VRSDDLAEKAADRIRSIARQDVRVAIVLGSGLGEIANTIEARCAVDYPSIPGFPPVAAPGHVGKMVIGQISGTTVAAMSGRPHLYEGYNRSTVTFPVRVLRQLGAAALVVTNAAGGVNPLFKAGDLMLITDHIDLTFTAPSTIPQSRSPFARLGFHYDESLLRVALREAKRLDVKLRTGTYVALTGPNYETEAEMNMLERIGADAVGMSTVMEATEAFRLGMNVIGFSCIANARRRTAPLTHDEVERTVREVAPRLGRLIAPVVSSVPNRPTSP